MYHFQGCVEPSLIHGNFSGGRIPDFYPNKAGSFLGYSGVLFLYYSTPLNFGLIDWDI